MHGVQPERTRFVSPESITPMSSSNRVVLFDTTLRDGEQSPGAAMTLSGKLRIARLLASMNVDVIEAGFPISSPQQAEAVRAIIEALEGTRSTICALARAHEADVQAAGRRAGGRRQHAHPHVHRHERHPHRSQV